VPCFEFVLVSGRGACFFFGRPAEEAALVLRDGLSATMEMSLSSESFLLLLLLICGSIGDEKGVLKVNRAEERGGTKFSSEPNVGTKFSSEPNVGTKFGCIWYFFGTKTKTKTKSNLEKMMVVIGFWSKSVMVENGLRGVSHTD
jgi:hypothetical protein